MMRKDKALSSLETALQLISNVMGGLQAHTAELMQGCPTRQRRQALKRGGPQDIRGKIQSRVFVDLRRSLVEGGRDLKRHRTYIVQEGGVLF